MASAEDDARDVGKAVTPPPIVRPPAWWGPIANRSEQLQLAAAECNFTAFSDRIGFDENEVVAFVESSTQCHRYLVCGSLSSTRFSWVYLALDVTGDRPVVLKISTREIEPEGRALMRLDHPHVVTVHDMFVFAGYPTLVLEWCSQGNLESFALGADDWRKVLARGLEAGRGLVHCHERGLVHGDVKPANALVARGVGKLADLGMARPETLDAPWGGTTLFAPPERSEGAWLFAGDVYSFARMLEWVLEKFDEVSTRIEAEGIGTPRERVPEAVLSLLAPAVAEKPKKRPPLPRLIADLERVIADDGRERLDAERRNLEKSRRRVYLQAAVISMAAIVTMGSATLAAQCMVEPQVVQREPSIERAIELADAGDPLGAMIEVHRLDQESAPSSSTELNRLAESLLLSTRLRPESDASAAATLGEIVSTRALRMAKQEGDLAGLEKARKLRDTARAVNRPDQFAAAELNRLAESWIGSPDREASVAAILSEIVATLAIGIAQQEGDTVEIEKAQRLRDAARLHQSQLTVPSSFVLP